MKNAASGEPRARVRGRAPFYDAASYRKEDSVGFMMKRCLSLLVRNLDVRMQPLDLTGMQWQPLLMVMRGCDTVAACARALEITSGAATRMLDRLEAKGLLVRERSAEDRRVVNLALTERGREVAHRIPGVLADVLNEHLRNFDEEEFRTLLDLLGRFASDAQALAEGQGAEQGAGRPRHGTT